MRMRMREDRIRASANRHNPAILELTRFDGHLGRPGAKPTAHMNKSPKTEPPTTHPATLSPSLKRYDEAFKKQAVENWIKSGTPGTRIAAELGVSYPSLKDWKRRYWGDATPQRADPVEEIRALKAELARVREQRDILKKTLGIFIEPSKHATKPSNG